MVTAKIRAALTLLRSQHFMLFTLKNGKSGLVGAGPADLADMIELALQLKNAYSGVLEMTTEVAAENGELHLLKILREKVEELENGGK